MEETLEKVNIDGNNFEFILNEKYDERNPLYSENDKIIYCSDETGIFNLYEYDLITKKKTQLTNVIGGALVRLLKIIKLFILVTHLQVIKFLKQITTIKIQLIQI